MVYYLDWIIAVFIFIGVPCIMFLLVKHEDVKNDGGLRNWFQNLRCKIRWTTDTLRRR